MSNVDCYEVTMDPESGAVVYSLPSSPDSVLLRQPFVPPPPHKIEMEIENFLENFKRMQSDYVERNGNISLLDVAAAADRTLPPLDFSIINANRHSAYTNDSSDFGVSATDTDRSPKDSLSSAYISSPNSFSSSDEEGQRSGYFSSSSILSIFDRSSVCPSDYVMGEGTCTLTVVDVAETLQARFAYISGGRSRKGNPLITFPDNPGLPDSTEEQYRLLTTYLTSIPSLQEIDLGFVIILDRRREKWSSVKTMLLKISGYFPGLVTEVCVLRPQGFLQKTFSDLKFKSIKDDFKFKVLMCNSLDELYEHIDKSQLTEEFGGDLSYDHGEWINHRAAIEKFSSNTSQIGQSLRDLCHRLQLTEFPNNIPETEQLILNHKQAHAEVCEDLNNTIKHGEILLHCFKTIKGENGDEVQLSTERLPANKIVHITCVERLLLQLEETQRNFSQFWESHDKKLLQCLQLRRFEEEFKQLQVVVEAALSELSCMDEVGDSMERVEVLLGNLNTFENNTKEDLNRADELRQNGEDFIEQDHYAVDCIRPKCIELQRMCEQYKEFIRKRNELLNRSRDFHDRIDRAQQWCREGTSILNMPQSQQSTTLEVTRSSIHRIGSYLQTSSQVRISSTKDFQSMFNDVLADPNNEKKMQSAFDEMDSIKAKICERKASLEKSAITPQPIRKTQSLDSGFKSQSSLASGHGGFNGIEEKKGSSDYGDYENESHSPCGSVSSESISSLDKNHPSRGSTRKLMRHVMDELINTERAYVQELNSILTGYMDEMKNPSMQHLIPQGLHGQEEVIFGNLTEIYRFHADVFLKDLENCRLTPAKVGQCFVDRHKEFQMYSVYCQNKHASEALRRDVGDNNPFFKECQHKLNHKLPLSAYLLKPVQRITKYQLLLKEMLRHNQNDPGSEELQQAIDAMLAVIKFVNDSMHQIAITGFPGRLSDSGKLLMQGAFNVWTGSRRIKDIRFKPMQRHVFLYDKMVLFCKRKDDPHNTDKAPYVYKNHVPTISISLTESVKTDKKKFEIRLHGRSEVYVLQSPSVAVKETWVSEIKKVLLSQFDKIKESVVQRTTTKGSMSAPIEEEIITPMDTSMSYTANNCINNNGDSFEDPSSRGVDNQGHHVEFYHEEGYSTDEDDSSSVSPQDSVLPDDLQGLLNEQYIALGDYNAVDSGEITMLEGDIVELIRIGSDGWWYVRRLSTSQEGWAPASYLESAKRRSMHSTHSTYSNHSSVSVGSMGKSHVLLETVEASEV